MRTPQERAAYAHLSPALRVRLLEMALARLFLHRQLREAREHFLAMHTKHDALIAKTKAVLARGHQ